MKLPPYGRRLLANPELRGTVFVYCGKDGIARANINSRAGPILAVRQEEHPSIYDWHLVRGREVLVVEFGSSDSERLEQIVYCLLLAGADLVVSLPEFTRQIHSYRQEAPSNAA